MESGDGRQPSAWLTRELRPISDFVQRSEAGKRVLISEISGLGGLEGFH